jgi:prevent-host-death family protein
MSVAAIRVRPMKTIPIEELRRHLGQLVKSEEPVLITRYGKPAGVFYPLPEPKAIAEKGAKAAAESPRKKRKRGESDATLDLPFDPDALRKSVRS